MKIKTMPKQTAAELILFIAENEKFDSVKEIKYGIEVAEVRALLREVASAINAGDAASFGDVGGDVSFSDNTKKVLGSLSSTEGEELLAAFGFGQK
jgi:hypothetical protein